MVFETTHEEDQETFIPRKNPVVLGVLLPPAVYQGDRGK